MKKLLISALLLGAFISPFNLSAQTDYSGRQPIYRATHTKTTDLIHTKLKVKFDYEKEQMAGEEWLTAAPYFYPSDSLVLDAKAMLIHEVALVKSGKKQALNYQYNNHLLKISLDKTYQKGEKYTVYIRYIARPNEVAQQGSAAITDAKGLYFIDPHNTDPEKPTQIWTQGETESSSVWFPTIDKPNQKTTEEIYMTVPDQYVTLSNGILKSSKKIGNGLRTDHWVMEKPHAPYLFFMAVGDYAIVKDHWKNIPVEYYVEKEYEPYAKQIYGDTPEMIAFYSEYLNYDFPWSKYAQINGRDYVSGAMENTTATIHSTRVLQKPGQLVDENIWEATIAHELFHHWFGDLVTTESWSNLTVNESFANYSEYLWFEHKYGKDYADYHLFTDSQRYLHNASDFSKDLVRFDYKSREDVFDLVTYNKGGRILHMLRNYVGDDAFRASLHYYLKTHEYQNTEAQQLRLAFEKVTGKDLNWFFNQWYYGNGNPKLSYTTTYEPVKKQVRITLEQTQKPLFQFPLTIEVYVDGKPEQHKVWVSAKKENTFSFPTKKQADFINLNADGVLLAEIDENKTPEQYLVQYQNSKSLYSRQQAVEAAIKNAKNSEAALKTLVAALKDPFFRIRMKALSGLDLSQENQAKMALSLVEKLAKEDPKTLVQGAAIAALGKTKDTKYEPLYEKGIQAVSNSVRGNTLVALAAINPEKVKQYAEKIDLENASEELLTAMLPIVVENKITSQMEYLAPIVAFYPFLKFQDPQLGTTAEKAFNWIMESDNTAATQSITKILGYAKEQVKNNPQAKMMIVQMLKQGLKKKLELLRAHPQSTSLEEQVKLLNKTIADYK